ncbi:hypothetical protein PENCOP_c013G06922 [Penicillium coprophilum]|uniref:Uncharacterized protein n=1 Tax=Penicillium coprophilum TaxID=36646 RepID=A0A1V6UBR8_9EURO|nr:hypothetical protein PENCOP_c013G06922 [Penicillium coprophilum]
MSNTNETTSLYGHLAVDPHHRKLDVYYQLAIPGPAIDRCVQTASCGVVDAIVVFVIIQPSSRHVGTMLAHRHEIVDEII